MMAENIRQEIWLDYVADSLEETEAAEPLDNYRAVKADAIIDDKMIREYFSGNFYPYAERINLKEYYQQKLWLQVELVKLHNWVQENGLRVMIIFEGRDAAGKGSTIKRFMEHLNPRWARVVALEKPTEEERGQWYFQRYVKELPSRGEIVFFDRSWYNRAGVERVMGFCSETEYQDFLQQVPVFEQLLVSSGIHLVKFYMSVSRNEQARRFHERETNPLKQWKLSPVDLAAQLRWDEYTVAKKRLFEATNTAAAPWNIVKSEDKMRGRLETMRFTLNHFDYPEKDQQLVPGHDPLIISPVSVLLDRRGKFHMEE